MPIYEYLCRDCGRTSSFLTLGVQVSLEPKCKNCGGSNLRKLVSRVAVIRSSPAGDDSPSWEENGSGGMSDGEPTGPPDDDDGMGSDLE
jgi:putative FmdB family regulatory protein